jgi:hypothetical protein
VHQILRGAYRWVCVTDRVAPPRRWYYGLGQGNINIFESGFGKIHAFARFRSSTVPIQWESPIAGLNLEPGIDGEWRCQGVLAPDKNFYKLNEHRKWNWKEQLIWVSLSALGENSRYLKEMTVKCQMIPRFLIVKPTKDFTEDLAGTFIRLFSQISWWQLSMRCSHLHHSKTYIGMISHGTSMTEAYDEYRGCSTQV